ncbi:MAG: Gfo/Idh/MocA family protein [Bacillota bacterium]
MTNKYGLALIGAGDRGGVYCRTLKRIPGINFISVCDLIPERAADYRQKYGFLHACGDYREAVGKEGVDLVFICAPAYFHPEMAIYAMQKGKHVYSEKPMALSLKDGAAVIETEKSLGAKLGFGLQYRHMGGFRKVKTAVKDGLLGRPVLMRFSDVRELRPKRAMHDAEHGNGGPVVDMCCHFIDLMRWFFDADPVRITARGFTFAYGRPEISRFEHKALDTAVIIIEYSSGDIGEISICWGLPPGINSPAKYDILGPKGILHPDQAEGVEKIICGTEGNQACEIKLSPAEEEESGNPELYLAQKFLRYIEGDGGFPTGSGEAYIALAASLAALKSAATGRPVLLEEILKERPSVIDCMSAKG